MKSQRNRSRSKGNRNRSVGNVVNRVFDSSGPEGKVRGTPQQIIDKYNQLTRDAQLSGDRVAAENFQQHAEHYLRMLAEAQREQDARRDQQNQNQNNQQNNNQGNQNTQQPQGNQGNQGGQGGQGGQNTQGNARADRQDRPDRGSDAGSSNDGASDPNTVLDPKGSNDSGLVDTPESTPKPRRSRSRNRPRSGEGGDAPDDASEKRQDDKAKDTGGDGKSGPDTPPKEAAE